MTGAYLPTPEWLTLEWHHATIQAGRLCIQRCGGCGRWRHPPRRFCPACFSGTSSFAPVAGVGTVVSYAISHRSLDPEWQAVAPFVTLVVELDEGPRVLATSRLDTTEASIGWRVGLVIEARSADFAQVHATGLRRSLHRDRHRAPGSPG